MLLGDAANGLVTHDAFVSTQSPYWGLFVQDDIKVSRSLTINLGLRYELEIPRSERYNRLSVFDPTVTNPLASQVPGYGNLKGGLLFLGKDRAKQFDTDKNNFGPRFGFAWRVPRGFVLRGGYAVFYSASSGTAGGTLGGAGNAGFASSTPFRSSLDGGLTPADHLANPFPRGYSLPPGSSLGLLSFAGQDFNTPNLYDRTPYVQQWNFNIQKEILPGTLLEIGYAGSKGTHLPLIFGAINQLTGERARSRACAAGPGPKSVLRRNHGSRFAAQPARRATFAVTPPIPGVHHDFDGKGVCGQLHLSLPAGAGGSSLPARSIVPRRVHLV